MENGCMNYMRSRVQPKVQVEISYFPSFRISFVDRSVSSQLPSQRTRVSFTRVLARSFSSKADAFPIFQQPWTGWNNLGNVESDQIIWRTQSPIWRAQSSFMIVFQIGSLEWAPRCETIDFSFGTCLYRWISHRVSSLCSMNDPFSSIISFRILTYL